MGIMPSLRQFYGYVMSHAGVMYAASGLIACAICILSLTPLEELPDVPGGDKLHHFIAYGALAFPTAVIKSRYLIILTLAYLALGGAIELIQPYVNRYGEWFDFIANAMGTMLGTSAGLLISAILRMPKHHPK